MRKILSIAILVASIFILTGCGRDQQIEDVVYGIVAANPGKPFKPCDTYYESTQYEALTRLIKKGKITSSKEGGLEIVP